MRRITCLAVLTMAGLAGCVMSYSLVAPGLVTVQDLKLQADGNWNRAPANYVPLSRRDAETWTRDGLLLDRLVIVPGVPDGEPVLYSREPTAALPVFRADMLPNEIEELVESSLVKVFGEGQSVVNTANLRPQRFGEHHGVMFDFEATVTDSPEYRGTAGAFVANDKLYLVYFIGAVPHYYDKHLASATAVIQSALL